MASEHMRYLGVLALLGSLSVHLTEEEDRETIEMALDDAVEAGAISYRRIVNRFEVGVPEDPS